VKEEGELKGRRVRAMREQGEERERERGRKRGSEKERGRGRKRGRE
jgi:hypothetical protein